MPNEVGVGIIELKKLLNITEKRLLQQEAARIAAERERDELKALLKVCGRRSLWLGRNDARLQLCSTASLVCLCVRVLIVSLRRCSLLLSGRNTSRPWRGRRRDASGL